MMSIKSIIFFSLLFLIIIYLYFNNEFINKCQSLIKYSAIIIGILMMFLYPLSGYLYGEYDYNEIKYVLLDKFKKN